MKKQIHPSLQNAPLVTVALTLGSRMINVGGIGTTYYDVGVGDPLILIHGSGRDRSRWHDCPVMGPIPGWIDRTSS